MACDHPNLTGRFCPDCGHPVGATQREPSEVRMMLQQLASLEPLDDIGWTVVQLGNSIMASMALRWSLGEITDEDLMHCVLPKVSRGEK